MRTRFPAPRDAHFMDKPPAGSSDVDERLYEQLADLLELRERSTARGMDVSTLVQTSSTLSPELSAYFEAADLVEQIATGLRPAPAPRLQMPLRLGDYELVREIGRGGTAIVYEAREVGLNRPVAIKMLCRGGPGSIYDVERIRFEAEAVAHLAHPGIVPVYDIGEHEGCPWFSMQYYEQGSLARALGSFADEPRRSAELVETIAEAVHHAHQRGILHRDLKPSNILLDADGRPRVADFGLAKRIGDDHDLTRSGEVIGTPSYMAPERIGGSSWSGPATTATDIYGLGAILFSLLTGRPPFEGATPVETLLAAGTQDVVRPSTVNPRIEPDLETICLRALEKNPLDRYATSADVARDLRAWLDGEPIVARPIHGVERLRRWARRHPVRATAAFAVGVLLMIGTLGLSAGYVVVSRAYQSAEAHRLTSEAHAAELNRRFYVSQMSLAHWHLRRGDLVELRRLLDEYRGQPEMQGFEWRWLDTQARAMPPELSRFEGHAHIIYDGAFSPDGRTVATCGADGVIRMWDSATGVEQRALENGAGLTSAGVPYDENSVQFSPAGDQLVSCGEDGGVRLWSLADGGMRALAPVRPAEALRAAFSRDGAMVAASWTDGTTHVWQASDGALVGVLESAGAPVSALAMGAGGEVVTFDRNGRLSVWNIEQQLTTRQIETGMHGFCCAVSPDGTLIAAAGVGDLVKTWSSRDDGPPIHVLEASDGVRSLAFSSDGSRLAAVGNDGCVRVWTVADHRRCCHFKAHTHTIWSAAFSPDGGRLLTVSTDMSARIWDTPGTSGATDLFVAGTEVRQLVFSPDGQHLATVDMAGELAVCAYLAGGRPVIVPAKAARHSRPLFVDNGRRLVFSAEDGLVCGWDVERGALLPSDPATPLSVNSHHDHRQSTQLGALRGNRLAAMTYDGDLFVRDAPGWARVTTPGPHHRARLLLTLPDEERLVLRLDQPPRTELWTLEGSTVKQHQRIAGQAECVAISPDGRWLAIGGEPIELVDISTAGAEHRLFGYHEYLRAIAFSPDGRTLVTVSQNGNARLWNVATGTELFAIEESRFKLYAADFSPDGAVLAIGGEPRFAAGDSLNIYRVLP